MDSRLKTLTELQLMVSGLEADLGISDMSEIERKVLLSLSDVYAQSRCGRNRCNSFSPHAQHIFQAFIVSCAKGSRSRW